MEVQVMKKTGIWAARVGLLGAFFWCSTLFAGWLCYSRTQTATQSGTMIWITALIAIQILLNISFSCTAKKQHAGAQVLLFLGLVLMRVWALLGTIDASAVRSEVITIVLGVLPGILLMHGLTQLGWNAAEYFWRKSKSICM